MGVSRGSDRHVVKLLACKNVSFFLSCVWGFHKSYVGCFQKATCKKIRVHMANNWDWQAKPLTLLEFNVRHLRCSFLRVPVLGVLLAGGEGLDWHLGPVCRDVEWLKRVYLFWKALNVK